jgi:hypothetical protein
MAACSLWLPDLVVGPTLGGTALATASGLCWSGGVSVDVAGPAFDN